MQRSWADRGGCLLLVLGLLAWAHRLWPDPGMRSDSIYLVIISVGYGHLLGALWWGRGKLRAAAPAGVAPSLWLAFLACTALTGLALHAMALHTNAAWAAPLFVVSVWHIVENDLLLGRAAEFAGRLPPVSSSPVQARAVIFSCGILAVSVATPEAAVFLGVRPLVPLSLVDVFAVVTGYHLLAWLIVAVRRTRMEARAGEVQLAHRHQLSIVVVHLACGSGCLAAVASGLPWLRNLATNPAIYLYWSALHALQTAWSRSRPGPLAPSPRSEAMP